MHALSFRWTDNATDDTVELRKMCMTRQKAVTTCFPISKGAITLTHRRSRPSDRDRQQQKPDSRRAEKEGKPLKVYWTYFLLDDVLLSVIFGRQSTTRNLKGNGTMSVSGCDQVGCRFLERSRKEPIESSIIITTTTTTKKEREKQNKHYGDESTDE